MSNNTTTPHNYYPEKPIVPFQKTPVTLAQLTAIIAQAPATKEVKRMVYVMLRNESANGTSINNQNPGGIQADSGRWDDLPEEAIAGVFETHENGTNKLRLFIAFRSLPDAVTFTCNKVLARQLYIGGTPPKIYKKKILTPTDLAHAYKEEWVTGSATALPSTSELANFSSMYQQAVGLFL